MTWTIGIYLFDDVEVLDFAGPFEVFSTASRVKLRREPTSPAPFKVITVAESMRHIRARAGLLIQPGFDISNYPPIDVVIIPGGDVTAELQRENIVKWISRVSSSANVVASVCTGAFLLGQAGLLDGRSATTHWEDIPDLRSMFPAIQVQEEVRWVETGKVITSAGISAGIDMSLHIVARLENEDLAIRTARQMEYDWHRLTTTKPA